MKVKHQNKYRVMCSQYELEILAQALERDIRNGNSDIIALDLSSKLRALSRTYNVKHPNKYRVICSQYELEILAQALERDIRNGNSDIIALDLSSKLAMVLQ